MGLICSEHVCLGGTEEQAELNWESCSVCMRFCQPKQHFQQVCFYHLCSPGNGQGGDRWHQL